MTDDTAEREALVKRLRDKAGTLFFNGMKSSAALMEEAATALESLAAPKCPACNGNDGDAPCAYPSEGKPGCLRDKSLAARPQTVTDAIDACAQLRDQSDLDLPPSWEPLFVEGYRHGCDECVSHIQNLAAVPPRASDTRSDLADLNYLRKPFPTPPPTSQWQAMDRFLLVAAEGLPLHLQMVDKGNNSCEVFLHQEPRFSSGGTQRRTITREAADMLILSIAATLAGMQQPLPAPPTEQDKP